MQIKPFSDELEQWLKKNSDKTVGDLADFFGEKSFAVVFLICMFIPALPIPTGGITEFVLLPITLIVAIEMILGFKSIWMPKKIRNAEVKSSFIYKGLPFMLKRIRKLEKFSKQRGALILNSKLFRIISGIIIFILAFAALIAPPFSGLDTVPSMGAVLISLALIIEDIYLYMVGIILGIIGIGILTATATVITAFFNNLLNVF